MVEESSQAIGESQDDSNVARVTATPRGYIIWASPTVVHRQYTHTPTLYHIPRVTSNAIIILELDRSIRFGNLIESLFSNDLDVRILCLEYVRGRKERKGGVKDFASKFPIHDAG